MSTLTLGLYWSDTVLWLGPWRAAEITPHWVSHDATAGQPSRWQGHVANAWSSIASYKEPREAMEKAESVVFGQLAALGIRRARFIRPDKSARVLEAK